MDSLVSGYGLTYRGVRTHLSQGTNSLVAGYGEPELGAQFLLAVRKDAHRLADFASAPFAHDEAEVEGRVVGRLGRLGDQICGETASEALLASLLTEHRHTRKHRRSWVRIRVDT